MNFCQNLGTFAGQTYLVLYFKIKLFCFGWMQYVSLWRINICFVYYHICHPNLLELVMTVSKLI